MSRDPDFTAPNVALHHTVVFAYGVPTTCGQTEIPKPCTCDWRFVSCPACVARRPPRLRVLTSNDNGVCAACHALHGRTVRGAATSPLPIPLATCTTPGGCRCRVENL